MAKLADLGLGPEVKRDVDYDNLPEQFAPRIPNLPMGTYRFRLPTNIAEAWEKIDAKDKGDRVRLQFDGGHPLLVTQAKDPAVEGLRWEGSISNYERKRSRRGEPERYAADTDYLLQALGHTVKVVGNADTIRALSQYGGKEFYAENQWSSYCSDNPEKVRYILDSEGKSVLDPSGKSGCGENYYAKEFTKGGRIGEGVETFGCPCGAQLRAFQNLANFRSIEQP